MMQKNNNNSVVHFDWGLLLFLVCIMNVKLYVKVFAILYYMMYIGYKKYKTGPLPSFGQFYFIMPVIGALGAYLHQSFAVEEYWVGFGFGVLNWLIAGLAVYCLYVASLNLDKGKIVATIKMFFLLNTLVSFGELGKMIIQSGQIVPYWYWEPTEYYGGSTGDHILGITQNISVTNATFNAIGTLFFLFYGEWKWAAMTIFVLLLCTSNMTLILVVAAIIGLMVIRNKKQFRLHALAILLIVGCIYPILSLNNIKYVDRVYSDELKVSEEAQKGKVKTNLLKRENKDFVNFNAYFQKLGNTYLSKDKFYCVPLNDTLLISYKDDLKYLREFGTLRSLKNDNLRMEPDSLKLLLEKWYGIPYDKLPLSAYKGVKKFYTVKQTFHYMTRSSRNAICGAGIGNFSSKLAIKMTGLGIQGDYPLNYIYVNRDYIHYHLFSVLYLFSMPIGEHSIINMANSVYNQVAGEYGIMGCLAFVLLYVIYVLRNWRKLHAGGYLFLMMLAYFMFEYWFEMVSLTVLIEFIVLFELYSKEKDAPES